MILIMNGKYCNRIMEHMVKLATVLGWAEIALLPCVYYNMVT